MSEKAQPASYSGMAQQWNLERALADRILMEQHRKELYERGDRAIAHKPRRLVSHKNRDG